MNQTIKDRMRGIVTRVRVIHLHLICALLWLPMLGSSNAIRAQCRAHPEIAPRISAPAANTSALVTQANVRAPDIIALTADNKLLRFNSADPGKIVSELPTSPINLHGESIVAIDYNPLGGYLYDKSNAQYVDALIANTGVAFSQADRDPLVNGLNNSTETRASGLRKVAENQTLAQQEFNRAFVLMQYFGYLRRNPNDPPDSDFSGYNFWLMKLNQFNGDYQKAEMVKAFITSGEYRKRFGP